MKSLYTIETEFGKPELIPVRSMQYGQIARIEKSLEKWDTNMIGEIIVCNVMGWFTLGTDRYWPSEYANKRNSYVPDLLVRPLLAGETITIKG